MKKNIFFIALILVVAVFSSCKKDKTPEAPIQKPLTFTLLSSSNDSMFVGDITTLTAVATGDGLTYTWSSEWGTFVGSGASVQWSACHAALFTVYCEVKDKYNASIKKSIFINVK